MAQCTCNERCHLCGAVAHAFWQGDQRISVCQTCAIDILPALLADAIRFGTTNRSQSTFRTLDTFTKRFWRALCLRMMAEGEAGRRDDDIKF